MSKFYDVSKSVAEEVERQQEFNEHWDVTLHPAKGRRIIDHETDGETSAMLAVLIP